MIRDFLLRLADFRRDDSLAIRTRLKRMAYFKELISSLPRPLRILDVGGTEIFWERMGLCDDKSIEVVIINLRDIETRHPNFKSVIGDARDMHQFKDGEFDVVFSNSVIEHVGGYENQKKMANEVRRIGKRYFLQTPNYYFPVEPHILFPFFQFFPLRLQVFLLCHFNLGWATKITSKERAAQLIRCCRLLKKKELKELFPGANIRKEKLMGLIMSYIVVEGWDK
jgi:2-polyprenyl-3-methyl-5-hydroxy-6-metoxy-1,4-benzoquinol methylase